MPKRIFIFCFSVFLLASTGCKKDNNNIPYGSSKNYSEISSSSVSTGGGTFSFTKITLNPDPVKIGVASKLIASATGNNLTFKWSTSHGDLFGTGSTIYYSDSCIGTYTVTCTVSDGVHSTTLTIPITVSG